MKRNLFPAPLYLNDSSSVVPRSFSRRRIVLTRATSSFTLNGLVIAIVGADFQTEYFIHFINLGSQHDNGYISGNRIMADRPADITSSPLILGNMRSRIINSGFFVLASFKAVSLS